MSLSQPLSLSQAAHSRTSRLGQESDVLKDEKEVVSEGEEGAEEAEGEGERNESLVSYEDRIIPAVMSRIKGVGAQVEGSEVGEN
jgi:hypothetical protein